MKRLLFLSLLVFGCSMDTLPYFVGAGAAARTITIFVDANQVPPDPDCYIRVGDCIYKITASTDQDSLLMFQCPDCNLRFGIRPTRDNLEGLATLVCPRCRRNVAVLHEKIKEK